MANDYITRKSLSYFLRHHPKNADELKKIPQRVDEYGYIYLTDLFKVPQFQKLTYNDIVSIVQSENTLNKQGNKKRYNLIFDKGWKIRANNGHSNGSNIDKDEITLENIDSILTNGTAIHGTYRRYINAIKLEGLKPMNRDFVHMAENEHSYSGMRYDCDTVIEINIRQMITDGLKVYKTPNDVIEYPGVIHPKYFKLIYNRK